MSRQQRYDFIRDDSRRRVIVKAREPLDAADLVAIVDRQIAEGAWRFGIVYDLRVAFAGATSPEDGQTIAAYVLRQVAAHGPRGAVAIVTRQPDMIAAGLMYAYRARKVNVEVFWDIDEAECWLDELTR